MWLPEPLYEALPYTYVMVGVLFISGTLYRGLGSEGAFLYIVCGLISVLSGLFVFFWRRISRDRSEAVSAKE